MSLAKSPPTVTLTVVEWAMLRNKAKALSSTVNGAILTGNPVGQIADLASLAVETGRESVSIALSDEEVAAVLTVITPAEWRSIARRLTGYPAIVETIKDQLGQPSVTMELPTDVRETFALFSALCGIGDYAPPRRKRRRSE